MRRFYVIKVREVGLKESKSSKIIAHSPNAIVAMSDEDGGLYAIPIEIKTVNECS